MTEKVSTNVFLAMPSNELGLPRSPKKNGAALLQRVLLGFHFGRIDLDELFSLRLGDFHDGL